MTGQALTATELVSVAGLTKQTVSGHLAKLVDAQLLAVEHQGRHRYFRLADPDVAHLLESLMGIAFRTGAVRVRSSPREPALRKARVCYDHLAGDLGVAAMDSLVERRMLRVADGAPELTSRGREFCAELGIALEPLSRQKRPLCRTCLDWSVRRPHLAGALGAAILARCFELGWAGRASGSRVVQFSAAGERAFRERFAVASSAGG
jgi:hypothetical protein